MDQSHLDQKYFIDSKIYNCPFCNRRHVRYFIVESFLFDWSLEKKCYGYVVKCASCENRSLHLSYRKLHDHQLHSFKFDDLDSEFFHSVPTSFFTIDDRVPKIIRELISEAEGSLKMNFLTGASACMRKAIYELLVHEKTDPKAEYKERVKSLKSKYGSIDGELFDILGRIQQMTSEKVHEQSWDKWNSRNLWVIIESLKEILYEIYVRPNEQREKMNRIRQLQSEAAQAKAKSKAPDEEDKTEAKVDPSDLSRAATNRRAGLLRERVPPKGQPVARHSLTSPPSKEKAAMASILRSLHIAVAASILLAGCATLPAQKQPQRFYPSLDKGTAWERIVQIYGINGWPITAIEKDSGIITSDWMLADPTFIDCGKIAISGIPVKEGEMKIGVLLTDAGEGDVAVTVAITGRTFFPYETNRRRTCYSTGRVEYWFAQALGLEYDYQPPVEKSPRAKR